jgi:hypothetical protein
MVKIADGRKRSGVSAGNRDAERLLDLHDELDRI